MKKYLSSHSCLSLLVSTLLLPSAFASDGTITITGTITDTTCTIAVNDGNADGTVTLPTVSAKTLAASGDVAGATPFSIGLSSCSGTSLGTATSYFEPGAYVDTESGRLNVDSATGSATNIQVQLLNSEREAIVAGAATGGQNDISTDIESGSGTLNYYAQYYATGVSTAGSVSTQVSYTIVYE